MTTKIAITGKSGSGKTTLTKSFLKILRERFPEKSVLVVDNDLSAEFGHTYGLDIRNTVYGIRSGKHEYKTGIPQHMTKSEYVEWALEDIVVDLDDYTDLIVTWFTGSKDCRCPITQQINDGLLKIINRYDFVIFDCEFDLKYLNQLVDTDMDLTLIVALPYEESVLLAKRIEEFSSKYAAGGQLGVVINRVRDEKMNNVYDMLKSHELEILGCIPFDQYLSEHPLERKSDVVVNSINQFYSRLNLPQ